MNTPRYTADLALAAVAQNSRGSRLIDNRALSHPRVTLQQEEPVAPVAFTDCYKFCRELGLGIFTCVGLCLLYPS